MKPIEYERMYEAEDNHWWYLGMAVITRVILDHNLPLFDIHEILDAGCGTGGAMSNILGDYGQLTGFDLSLCGLDYCKKRKMDRIFMGSVTDIPIESNRFDLVTSFEVLYHVEEDLKAMQELVRVLRPGGYLLLRLPAYEWMRRQHDIQVSTIRRYTAPQVRRLFEESGITSVRLTYVNTILFPLAIIKKLAEIFRPPDPNSSELSYPGNMLNGLLKFILSCEAPFAARFLLPYGLSIFALGQKSI